MFMANNGYKLRAFFPTAKKVEYKYKYNTKQ